MSTSQALAGELAQEAGTTRRALERVPDGQLDWRPHEKSYTLGELASHIANLPMWTAVMVREDELDLGTVGGPMSAHESALAILDAFDRNLADALSAIRDTPEEAWMRTWSLKKDGEVLFALPRIAALRSFVMNHSIHHRGQLSVYLRLTGVPVPQMYGPTADEPDFG